MKVFLISNMYPSRRNKTYGVFVQNTVQALEQFGVMFSKKSVLRGKSSNKMIKLLRYFYYYLGIVYHYIFGKYDLIYVHFLSHNTPILYFILKVFGKKKQWIINVHGTDVVGSEGKKIDGYNYFVLKESDLVITPSQPFVDRMMNQYPSLDASKYYVSPSGGINSSVFYPSKNQIKQQNKATIGFVSRIDAGKGWDVFLESIYLLKEDDISIHAIIAGGGTEVEELKTKIDHLKLTDQITYLGSRTQQELGKIYRSLDLFVFSTILQESLGLVAIEAMACGVTVIGSAIPGIKSYLDHGVNGFCFAIGDPKALAEHIKRYLTLSEEDRNTMKENAIETARRFDSQEVSLALYKKFESIYNSRDQKFIS